MEAIPWGEVSVVQTSSMRDAMARLETSARQIVLVVDEDDHLVGVVTDGDVRRALLSGFTLESNVRHAMNRNYHVAQEGYEVTLAESLMQSRGIRHLPVVDRQGRPVEVLVASGTRSRPGRRNRIVIMAGGRGSRLRPLTDEVPKPMLTVGGIPILELIVRNYASQGFRNFTFVVSYLSDAIRSHFLDGSGLGLNISYYKEEEPRGTAGSLARMNFDEDAPIVVANADVISSIDLVSLIRAHEERESSLTIASRPEKIAVPFGVLETISDRVVAWSEKPGFTFRVSAGMYVVNPSALAVLDGSVADMPDLVGQLLASGHEVAAYHFEGLWMDVGTHDALRAVNDMGSLILGTGQHL